MNYTLMQKNIPVIDLVFDEASGLVVEIGDIHNYNHLPIGTIHTDGDNEGQTSSAFLNGWWRGRAIIPKRYGLSQALPKLGVGSVEQYTTRRNNTPAQIIRTQPVRPLLDLSCR